mmetsp:Transcript_10529/g.23180  ORF Transcript_10529/g.23180 Transcript_10529/m.23180 type:complete len:531 (+) Transcript_10529:48-1640(+)
MARPATAKISSVQESDLEMDLLKEWVQTSYQRAVWAEKGPTRTATGWTALVAAFRYSRIELAELQRTLVSRASFGELLQEYRAQELQLPELCKQDIKEDLIRAVLVETYAKLRGPENADLREALLAKKKEDSRSVFNIIDAESGEKFFDWYLYCLSCPSDLGSQSPNTAEEFMHIPLDFVDLQVIADTFLAQITVLQYNDNAVRFRPSSEQHPVRHRLLLAMHHGIWVPLVEPKISEDLVNSLKDTLVRLKNLPPKLQSLETSMALVKGYDHTEGAYRVLVEDVELLVSCDSLNLENRPQDEMRQEWGGAAPFSGIPDGALEFYILLQMVCRDVSNRLEETKIDLANRAGDVTPVRDAAIRARQLEAIPADAMHERVRVGRVKSLANRPVKLVPLRDVFNKLNGREKVSLCATVRAPEMQNMLALDLGEFISISQCHGEDFLLGQRPRPDGTIEEAWCRPGAFCIYKANTRPTSTGSASLSFEVGDIIVTDTADGGATFTRGRIASGPRSGMVGEFDRSAMDPYVFMAEQ